jgi:hypothetical protein
MLGSGLLVKREILLDYSTVRFRTSVYLPCTNMTVNPQYIKETRSPVVSDLRVCLP